jgi:4-hydroxy-tetrahydrodipicolinate reductase
LASGANHKDKIEITSIREGDAVGQHVIFLDSPEDTMMLVHDAKSRRGYALGAIQAAEWIRGKTGFYEFAEIIASLRP